AGAARLSRERAGRGRVRVAMSGGLASSLAVARLQAAGYDVFGGTMRLSAEGAAEVAAPHKPCCAVGGADDARRVCPALGVPHHAGAYHLLEAADPEKDQSYFLYTLGQAELARLLLPVGAYRKPEIRARAAELSLPVAAKPDSQDVCFIPGGDYRAFLAERLA